MYENLMEEVVSAENYGKAIRAVIANDGSPGIDGMTTKELNGHLLKPLAKDPCEVDDGHLRSEPREAEGNPQRERRHEDVRDTDGTGSVHPADVAAGNDADLGAEIQRAQLWVSARAEGGGCGASRARVCDEGPGLGGRSRYHGVLRSRQLGHACVRAAR